MTLMDVDATSIPDMIEAQLTLSYSRLSHLIRLIIEQGNGHDMDIDKIMNRLDCLTKENAELRGRVDALTEAVAHSTGVSEEMKGVREEVSKVAAVSAENTDKLAALERENEERFSKLEARLDEASETYETEMRKVNDYISVIQELSNSLKKDVDLLNGFAALWDGQAERIRALTTRDSEGQLQRTPYERAKYLHSLPPFTKLFEELDVLRELQRHQATDSLAAKNVVGMLRRSSIADASTGSKHPPSSTSSTGHFVEKEALEKLESSVAKLGERMQALERDRLAASRGQASRNGEGKSSGKDSPCCAPHASALKDIEERLRFFEVAFRGGGFSPKVRQGPKMSEKDLPPIADGSQGLGWSSSVRRIPQGDLAERPQSHMLRDFHGAGRLGVSDGGESSATAGTMKVPSTQPHGGGNTSLSNTEAPLDATVEQTGDTVGEKDPYRSRIEKLEQIAAGLEERKADRHELVQLEEVLEDVVRRTLVTPRGSLVLPHARGSMQSRTEDDNWAGRSGRRAATSTPRRSVYVVGQGTYLNDATGTKTTATVANPREL
uniref:WGS project CAEQ00000000 data, annotated contig 1149 n=1 Tax=Trypanosoma congolense (strain IL3000) TaxID=1068625 RepID=F9W462_TRYCI|nr:unnamed protein product [Trypanosoma congolense IL3000]